MSDRRKLGALQDQILSTLARYGPLNARQIHNATAIKIEIIYVRLRQMELEEKVERCDPRTMVRGRVVASWRIYQKDENDGQANPGTEP